MENNDNRLSIKEYRNLIDMLQSPDTENQVMGLSIIEQKDFDDNMAHILLAKKHCICNNNRWEEHAPKTLKRILKIKILSEKQVFTYKDILKALTEQEVPFEQVQEYLDDFSNYLLGQITNLGYDFIEDIQLNIKLKKQHEPQREPSESV